MTLVRSRMGGLLLLAGMLALAGCPQVPKLDITPAAATFGSDRTEVALVGNNGGAQAVHWTLEEVVRDNADAPWVARDVAWLSEDQTEDDIAPGIDRVTLTADRSALVIGGATAPVGGEYEGRTRTSPQLFARQLKGRGAFAAMDAYSHHPYQPGPAPPAPEAMSRLSSAVAGL